MIKSDIRYTRRFSSERFKLPDNKLPFVKKNGAKMQHCYVLYLLVGLCEGVYC